MPLVTTFYGDSDISFVQTLYCSSSNIQVLSNKFCQGIIPVIKDKIVLEKNIYIKRTLWEMHVDKHDTNLTGMCMFMKFLFFMFLNVCPV